MASESNSLESLQEKINQDIFIVPDFTIRDLIETIPKHCYQRSAFRSFSYIIWDIIVILTSYKLAAFATSALQPSLTPLTLGLAKFAIWGVYSFVAGLFATGLWIIAHECGHQAFSESKLLNNAVGLVLHSALGIPYHSWRISHAKHHASTSHLTQDQAYIPRTRAQLGLPPAPADPARLHPRERDAAAEELYDALGESPLGTFLGCAKYLLVGFQAYLINNASGQRRYPKGTNHFVPKAPLFAPHQRSQILLSDLGILVWLAGLIIWGYSKGFAEVFRVYGSVYLWVNHWIVLITFLQHTDPRLPHYRASAFTFARGALATLDRELLGGCYLPSSLPLVDTLGLGLGGWLQRSFAALGAHATHGISETHVLHHVCSKIPHYHAWEAAGNLRARLEQEGIELNGRPGGWTEFYRVYRECKFVEDEGDVVFYKNLRGTAATRRVFRSRTKKAYDPEEKVSDESDSGIEVWN